MADPLISVIVPAYKAEATIARAVSSALAQSWASLEIVLASDDGRDYSAYLGERGIADDRIRQVATGGVGSGDWNARNTGLAAATGTLATILDADDAYAPNRLEAMAPLALADGAALDDTQLILGGRTVATLLRPGAATGDMPAPATASSILRDRVPVFPMWRRADFDIAWRRLPHAADVIFSLELLSAAPGMRIAANPGYRYFKRPGSMTLSASMAERSRAAYLAIIQAIAASQYALSREVADLTLYEIAKNLNQIAPFQSTLATDPTLTHEVLAMRFNDRPMTEAERFAFFAGSNL